MSGDNKESLEIACSILKLDFGALERKSADKAHETLKKAYDDRLAVCSPDPRGRMYTTEFKAVQAAYLTVFNALPSKGITHREDPTYKVDLTKSKAKYDAATFNALFEASKEKTLKSMGVKEHNGHVAAMESCPNYANVLKIKMDANDNIQILKSTKRATSTNNHFAVHQFNKEADKTIVLDQVDDDQVQQYKKHIKEGTARIAIPKLTAKAAQLKAQYSAYVQNECNRDQPVFSRMRG